jgi:hypothetical protein
MPKRILSANTTFTAKAEIAHYGATAIQVTPEWNISDGNGKVIASGKFSGKKVETGCTTQLGIINADLSKIKVAEKLLVTLSAGGTSNSWEIWVYPEFSIKKPSNVRIAYSFNKDVKDALLNGGRVLLFSSPNEGIIPFHKGMLLPDSLRFLPEAKPGSNAIDGSFMSVFWCTRLFNQTGTMGILCNPGHPAFEGFPTESHSNWQWADLLGHFTAANSFRVAGAPESMALDIEKAAPDAFNRSKAVLLDGTPADFRPILQIIDNYDRNAKLGTIFEARVGEGKLLVCAMDLETDMERRPAARQLMQSLLNYTSGDKFIPSQELSVEVLDKILTNKDK